MKSSSFWTCILTIKLYWKRRYIGTSAKKNHAYESPLYRVQILIILYSNAPYIAITNKNMSQSCLTMGMAVKKERTTINCPLFISYKFNFQSLSKCSCRQPQCLGNTAQSPPDGFARNLRADFPSYCPEIPCHTAVCLRNF